MLYVGLYLIALGNGGIKPNVSTLGADQFDESDPNERKHMSNFFNWFYFIISIGSLLSVTVFVYIQVNKILLGSVSFVSSFTQTELICPKSASVA
jgi:peptide/histidine transporter 3/4